MMARLMLLDDLRVLVYFVYSIKYPVNEQYGLQFQIRRAVISASLNIREGNSFRNDNRWRYFDIAAASLEETEECLLISLKLQYVNDDTVVQFYKYYWIVINKIRRLRKSGNQCSLNQSSK